MALQLIVPDPYGVAPVDKAYARIVGRHFDDLNGIGMVYVNVYRDEAARRANAQAIANWNTRIDVKAYSGLMVGMVVSGDQLVNPKDETPITVKVEDLQKTGLYNWLKTLPTFAGSIDV